MLRVVFLTAVGGRVLVNNLQGIADSGVREVESTIHSLHLDKMPHISLERGDVLRLCVPQFAK